MLDPLNQISVIATANAMIARLVWHIVLDVYGVGLVSRHIIIIFTTLKLNKMSTGLVI
jgi:hypothetical protein